MIQLSFDLDNSIIESMPCFTFGGTWKEVNGRNGNGFWLVLKAGYLLSDTPQVHARGSGVLQYTWMIDVVPSLAAVAISAWSRLGMPRGRQREPSVVEFFINASRKDDWRARLAQSVCL